MARERENCTVNGETITYITIALAYVSWVAKILLLFSEHLPGRKGRWWKNISGDSSFCFTTIIILKLGFCAIDINIAIYYLQFAIKSKERKNERERKKKQKLSLLTNPII